MELKPNFANGLKQFFTVGSLYERTYLTKGARMVLEDNIDRTLEGTFMLDEVEFERIIEAMNYLNMKLGRTKFFKLKMDKKIASTLYYWTGEQFRYFEGDNYDRAAQWVCNLWCRDYAVGNFNNR